MSRPRCAAPTWRAEVSPAAMSRSGVVVLHLADGEASPASTRPSRIVWSSAPTELDAGVLEQLEVPFVHAQDHRRGRCVEGELVQDDGCDLACSDAGEQCLPVLRIGVQQQCRARDRTRQQGCRREVVPQLLEHERRLDEGGTERRRTPRGRAAPPPPPARRASATAPRRTRTRSRRPCARQRCRCACRAASARSRRARPVPRCGRSAFSAPRPATSPRSGPGGTPNRPTRRRARGPG